MSIEHYLSLTLEELAQEIEGDSVYLDTEFNEPVEFISASGGKLYCETSTDSESYESFLGHELSESDFTDALDYLKRSLGLPPHVHIEDSDFTLSVEVPLSQETVEDFLNPDNGVGFAIFAELHNVVVRSSLSP